MHAFKLYIFLILTAFALQIIVGAIPFLMYFQIDFLIILFFVFLVREVAHTLLFAAGFLYGILLDIASIQSWGFMSFVILLSMSALMLLQRTFNMRSAASLYVLGLVVFGFFLILRAWGGVLLQGEIYLISFFQLVISSGVNSVLFVLTAFLYGKERAAF